MLKANLERDGLDLTFDTDLLHLDVTNRVIGIGTASPSGTYTLQIDGNMHVNSTDAILLPSGTTGERVNATGKLRYNTSDNIIEWYNGSGWIQPGVGGGEPNQNAFSIVTGDSGTATADSTTDTIAITGSGGITTTATAGASAALDIALGNTITLETLNVDFITISDNVISTNATNADLELDPSGTGDVVIISGNLVGPADPTAGNHVGDRDYNDARYYITVLDDTSTAITPVDTFTFGTNLNVTDLGDGDIVIDATGGGSIAIEDEGSEIIASATRLNFTGAGVTATDAGSGEATITIPSSGAITVSDSDSSSIGSIDTLNFGDNLTVIDDTGGQATIDFNGFNVRENNTLINSDTDELKFISNRTNITANGTVTEVGLPDMFMAGSMGAYILLEGIKATTVDGGTATLSTWTTRELTNITSDAEGLVALSSNQFTIPSGTYRVNVASQFLRSGRTRIRLYNVTDSTAEIYGNSVFADESTTNGGGINALINGRITITKTTTFRIEYYVTDNGGLTATLGLGTDDGSDEIYTQVELVKEDDNGVATGGVWEFVKSYSASSNDATLDLTDLNFSEADTEWEFYISAGQAKTASALCMRVDVGAGFVSSANYVHARTGRTSAGSNATSDDNSGTLIQLTGSISSTVLSSVGSIFCESLETTDRHKYFRALTSIRATNYVIEMSGGGYTGSNAAIEGVQFFFQTGNIEVLEISVYKRSLKFPSVVPVGGAVEVISSGTASSATEIDFTNDIDSNGDLYLLTLSGITTDTVDDLILRISDDGGATYESGASDYGWITNLTRYDGNIARVSDSADTDINLTGNQQLDTSADDQLNARIWIYNPSDTNEKLTVEWNISFDSNNTAYYFYGNGSGEYYTTSAINAFRITTEGGTAGLSGKYTLYKYRNHPGLGNGNPSLLASSFSSASVWTKGDGTVVVSGEMTLDTDPTSGTGVGDRDYNDARYQVTVLDDTSTALAGIQTFEFGDNLTVTDLGDGHVLVDGSGGGGSDDPLARRAPNIGTTASTDIGAVLPASCYIDRVTVNVGTAYDNSAELTVTAGSGVTSLVSAGQANLAITGVYIIHLGMTGTSAGQVNAAISNSPTVGNCTVTVHYKVIT